MILVTLAIFIAILLFAITLLIPSKGPFIAFCLGICILGVAYICKYIGETTPQRLNEGDRYIFIGADPAKGWLFLKKHVHIDAVDVKNILIYNNSNDLIGFNSVSPVYPIHMPAEDYDLPGTYAGAVLNFDIKPGAEVVVVKYNDIIGIVLAGAAA